MDHDCILTQIYVENKVVDNGVIDLDVPPDPNKPCYTLEELHIKIDNPNLSETDRQKV